VVEVEDHQEVVREVVAEEVVEDDVAEEELATSVLEPLNTRDSAQPSASMSLTMGAKVQPIKCATRGKR
jgi:hypothetical protein